MQLNKLNEWLPRYVIPLLLVVNIVCFKANLNATYRNWETNRGNIFKAELKGFDGDAVLFRLYEKATVDIPGYGQDTIDVLQDEEAKIAINDLSMTTRSDLAMVKFAAIVGLVLALAFIFSAGGLFLYLVFQESPALAIVSAVFPIASVIPLVMYWDKTRFVRILFLVGTASTCIAEITMGHGISSMF